MRSPIYPFSWSPNRRHWMTLNGRTANVSVLKISHVKYK